MKKNFLLACFIVVARILNAQVITVHHPEIIPVKLERISSAVRSIPQRPVSQNGNRVEHDNFSLEHPIPITNPNALPHGADPALQKVYGQRSSSNSKMDTASSPISILSNWEGLSQNVDPSDNNIAVGTYDVVQLVNSSANSTSMRVWDKSTGTVLTSNTQLQDLTGLGDYGDPSIIYDQQADRYVFIVLSLSGSKLIIALSQTSDPMGSYYAYSFHTANGFPDYPKLAVWGNSYFITTNSNNPTIFALNRDSLLVGAPLTYAQKFSLSSFPTISFQSASPVQFTGTLAPPAGAPELIMRVADDAWGGNLDSDHLEIFKEQVDWVDTSNSSISGPYNLLTLPYNSNLCGFDVWDCIPQKGSNTKLDPLSDILMDKVKYLAFPNHEAIVCTHVVNKGDGKAGVRWYELRKESGTDWYIYQQGTFAPTDTNYRFMSSITINQHGVIALGYNISSKMVYPGVRITGRVPCDDLGLMTIQETSAIDGSAANGINRYGDYNGMVTDPVDGSFWLTGQYNPSSSWSTNVTHFTITPCLADNTNALNSGSESFSVAPNPATNQLDIVMQSTIDQKIPMQLIDVSGKRVMEKILSIHAGSNTSTLDLHSVNDGVYFVQLNTKDGMEFQKVVIQR